MRAFIAIDLPESVRRALGQIQAELQKSLARSNIAMRNRESDIRWSRPEGIHLTLKFLGEMSEAQAKKVADDLASMETFKSIPIEVKGFGFFPGPARPRVFWVGVEALPGLAQLAGQIEDRMEKLGFPRESRNFNPHLTLARFKDPRPHPSLRALVEERGNPSFGLFEASEFFLFESKLSPHGAQYRKVACFPDRAKEAVKKT